MTGTGEPQYWLERDGDIRGPYPFEVITAMWQRKELRLTDRLCKQGAESWTEVARLMKALDQAAHSQSDQHRNPPSYGVVVTLTIFFPIVGLIMGIVWLSQPRYRGAGGAIVGIALVVGFIWYAVIRGGL